MGFLWDLIQHNQIQDQRRQSDTLDARVRRLEEELLQALFGVRPDQARPWLRHLPELGAVRPEDLTP